jgi:hypothetical protein
MTVSVQQPFTASVASGSGTVFPYGFKVAHADDLSVMVDGALQSTGYSVTGVGDDAGGDVVFDVAPDAGAKVLRYLNPQLKRETDYQQFGDWLAAVVNLDFDRLWLAMQMLAQNTARSLKLPVDTATNQEITADAAIRANKGIKFDGDGNLIVSDYDPDDAQASAQDAVLAAQAAAASAEAAAEAFGEGGVLAVEYGGTGAATAANARTALSVPSATGAGASGTWGIGISGTAAVATLANTIADGSVSTAAKIADNIITPAKLTQKITLVAAVTVSGTSVDFTDIPSWVNRITVALDAVSTNGTSPVCLQIGTSSGFESSGYDGLASNQAPTTASYSVGFLLNPLEAAANTRSGHAILTKANGNRWVFSSTTQISVGNLAMSAGAKTLAGTLDRLRLTTNGGTATFDAGSINIIFEG